jgi:hypothetical protein
LRLFEAMVWKLLIVEPFFQWKLNKNWNWKLYWNLGEFLMLVVSLWRVRFYFTIFRAKGWNIMIFEWFFFAGNSNKLQKIGFGRKNELSPQSLHIAEFSNFQFWKSEKLKNAFTLRPTGQATLSICGNSTYATTSQSGSPTVSAGAGCDPPAPPTLPHPVAEKRGVMIQWVTR